MARVILIVGDTGTGKSRSIKTLDSKETYIFNTLGKDLTFKGSGALYNKENKNLFSTQDYKRLITTLKQVPEALPHIKNIVIDDIGFVAVKEFFDRALEKGWNIMP